MLKVSVRCVFRMHSYHHSAEQSYQWEGEVNYVYRCAIYVLSFRRELAHIRHQYIAYLHTWYITYIHATHTHNIHTVETNLSIIIIQHTCLRVECVYCSMHYNQYVHLDFDPSQHPLFLLLLGRAYGLLLVKIEIESWEELKSVACMRSKRLTCRNVCTFDGRMFACTYA